MLIRVGQMLKGRRNDEDVTLFVRQSDCTWTRVGKVRTDDRGIATFKVPAAMLAKPARPAFVECVAQLTS